VGDIGHCLIFGIILLVTIGSTNCSTAPIHYIGRQIHSGNDAFVDEAGTHINGHSEPEKSPVNQRKPQDRGLKKEKSLFFVRTLCAYNLEQ
jgi:hypothetical protein